MGVESVLEAVASQTGASVPALRLVFSVLLGYPIALIHRHTLYGKNKLLQHLYFIFTGLLLGYYNYGTDVIHHVITVTTCYAVLYLSPGSLLSVAFTFIFTMTYLLVGYYLTSTDSYDIVWTMPECVLVMKLTGLAYNLYDGLNPQAGLSKHAQSVALTKMPCPFQVFAHSFFPLTFLIGPHFSMTRYQDFVAGKFTEKESVNGLPNCVKPAITRSLLGFTYLGIYQLVNIIYSDEYMVSDEYMYAPFWKRSFVLGVWGRSAFYKYISVWLLGEGAIILSGLSYNGVSDSGKSLWNGCANVSLSVFEGATKFTHYVDSFNINTNHWVLENIYKRLKFLGNRLISQAAVLLFLAVWHGFHSGYYATFFMEFIIIAFEKDFISVLEKNVTLLEFTRRPYISSLTYLGLKVYTFVFLGYCIGPFALLSYSKWIRVYTAYLFLGHVLFMMWPLYKIAVVRWVLPPQRPVRNGKEKKHAE
ncbi:hypothetical protein M8J76_001524 [Diaphorina citri]|nr:hypothetical protein M8J76_001524 [Diaphorina citri]KAI5755149.1 hypothetical protein M8J77_014531 [Diaphorina citri]